MNMEHIRDFAIELKNKGYTLNVLNNGKLILRMGKNASSGILTYFAPIEIKDLKTLLKLIGSNVSGSKK
ncbi:MAG: hypothetical protein DRN25_00830 [Thermoplasmata archaeon]|nr:MAG: hypothetical protein DRN25_00830 [Thermoplasmata archaeon]